MAEPLQQEEIGADPMEATIRDSYRGMQQNAQIGSEETADAVVGAEPTETTTEVEEGSTEASRGLERDEHGRFKPKAPVEAEAEQIEPVEEVEDEDDTPYGTPPSSWKKEAIEGWKELPAHVRQEVHRREQNMLDGLKQYKEAADFGNTLYREFAPYEPLMRSLNTNVVEATRTMLNQEYILRSGTPEQKGALIAEAIQSYGIDPNLIRLDGGNQIPADLQPHLAPLQQEVQELKRQLMQRDEQARQASDAATRAQQTEVHGEVETFRSALDNSGKLKAPYFDQVRDDMAALIANGRASDLQDAYDKATWANPEVRAKLIAKQQKAEREAAAKKAADAKKAAAANVETQGALPEKPQTGAMEDTIREQYRKLVGS